MTCRSCPWRPRTSHWTEEALPSALVFLTGASGSGKTSLLEAWRKAEPGDEFAFLHFDSMGVPSAAEMVRDFGSGRGWQEHMTRHWVKTAVTTLGHKRRVVLEGQMDLAFVFGAVETWNVRRSKVVLVHCDASERHHRLLEHRHQGELVNAEMDGWADHLASQARKAGVPVLDTTGVTVETALQRLRAMCQNG